MGISEVNPAVFLDRDGVINPNVYNDKTRCWESPHLPSDFRLHAGVLAAAKKLQSKGYRLFIVSNQPSYAKGKTSLENIIETCKHCEDKFSSVGVNFTGTYYCLHHPDGIVSDYTCNCVCRKPSPYFLLKAITDHNISIKRSWMVGDRHTDIVCGRKAGCRTIHILPDHPCTVYTKIAGDYWATNLVHAADIILNCQL
jgi:D-glycero-D-manno-heptose 1,7-bisphosphate phosphatase